jgi:hypothetical protein
MPTRKVTIVECDNPECDSEYIDGEEDGIGYHFLKGYQIDGGGGWPIPKVYACSKDCLAPAIEAVVMQADGYEYAGKGEWVRAS